MEKSEKIKKLLKRISLLNSRWEKKKRGIILLICGKKKWTRMYANHLYLNLEPNNVKLICRKDTSRLLWLKYAPEFGKINIIVDGWMKKKDVKNADVIEDILQRGSIEVHKLYLCGNDKKDIKTFEDENGCITPWRMIECTGEPVEDMEKILESVEVFFEQSLKRSGIQEFSNREHLEVANTNNVEQFHRSYEETEYTLGNIEKVFKASINDVVRKLKKREKKIVLIFEGMDASGKGSAIKSIMGMISPKLYDLYRIGPPKEEEKNTHFLKRFISKVYNNKTVIVLDRSWYGRVLVERVEKLDDEECLDWAYDTIGQFERELEKSDVHVLKFWMNVSKEEQKNRFLKRIRNENKRWKIESMDWKNRLKLDRYEECAQLIFRKCSYKFAPWIIINGDNKRCAQAKIQREILNFLENIKE